MKYVLAIDQGTTSTRAIIFNESLVPIASAQEEFTQFYPQSGWVEHDPQDLWGTTASTCRGAIERANFVATNITSIGITNQRETTLVWNRKTGQPIYNAIVWQDRRTANYCKDLCDEGYSDMFADRTGLLIDPYFSATKLKWILDNVDGARDMAKRGELLFGTVDTFLIWKLTGGKEHLTEKINDSRFIKDGVFGGAESIEVIIDAQNKISKLIFEYDESIDKNNKIESYVKDLGIPIVKSGKAIWNDGKTQFEIYTKRKKGKNITYSKLIDLETK